MVGPVDLGKTEVQVTGTTVVLEQEDHTFTRRLLAEFIHNFTFSASFPNGVGTDPLDVPGKAREIVAALELAADGTVTNITGDVTVLSNGKIQFATAHTDMVVVIYKPAVDVLSYVLTDKILAWR
jgi:hypothetical protein